MAEFHLAASVSGSWYRACWLTVTLSCLTGTLEYNRAIVNVISNTCAFPVATSQTVCCETGLWFRYNMVVCPAAISVWDHYQGNVQLLSALTLLLVDWFERKDRNLCLHSCVLVWDWQILRFWTRAMAGSYSAIRISKSSLSQQVSSHFFSGKMYYIFPLIIQQVWTVNKIIHLQLLQQVVQM